MSSAPPIEDRPYTANEVAEALGVHKKTIRKWLIDGRVKGFKIPGRSQGRWYVTRAELERIKSGEALAAHQTDA